LSYLAKIRNPRPAKVVVESDEMHSYVGHKKTTGGFGLVLIEKPANTLISLLGTETKTGLKLWSRIECQAEGIVATDCRKSHNEMISAEKLLQTKAETYTVESYNGQIRHSPVRFRRKTTCYSKSGK